MQICAMSPGRNLDYSFVSTCMPLYAMCYGTEHTIHYAVRQHNTHSTHSRSIHGASAFRTWHVIFVRMLCIWISSFCSDICLLSLYIVRARCFFFFHHFFFPFKFVAGSIGSIDASRWRHAESSITTIMRLKRASINYRFLRSPHTMWHHAFNKLFISSHPCL